MEAKRSRVRIEPQSCEPENEASWDTPRRLLAQPGVAEAVASVLCNSHANYPGFTAVFPQANRRARALRPFLTLVVEDALRHGTVHGIEQGGVMVGAALWLGPGAHPWSAIRRVRSAPKMIRVLHAAPGDFRRLVALGSATERAHPRDCGWYLETLGVRHSAQGRGLGSALLRGQLGKIDADRLPACLETADSSNLPFYERFGFKVAYTFNPISTGPTYWSLRRLARG